MEPMKLNADAFRLVMGRMYRRGIAPWEIGRPCPELEQRLANGDLPCTGRALEIGCGTGVHALRLARHGLDVTGVDISEVAVSQARLRAADAGADVHVRFIAGDVTDLRDLGEPYDVLLDRGCYHLMRQRDLPGYRDMLRRVSKPGTVLCLLACNAQESSGIPDRPEVHWQDIVEELGSLFSVVERHTCRIPTRDAGKDELFWSVLLKRA